MADTIIKFSNLYLGYTTFIFKELFRRSCTFKPNDVTIINGHGCGGISNIERMNWLQGRFYVKGIGQKGCLSEKPEQKR